jgi:tRNA-dihydrouridine synthase
LEGESTVSLEEKRGMINRHFSLLQAHYGEKGAVIKIRKHIYWYTKGLPCCASFHSELPRLKEKERLFEEIHSYFDSIEVRELCQSSTSVKSKSVTG